MAAIFLITLSSSGVAVGEYNSVGVIQSVLGGIYSGVGGLSLSYLALSIAKKAELESRINEIKEKLELLDLKSNTDYDEKYSQSEDYYEPILGFDEEEKGRKL